MRESGFSIPRLLLYIYVLHDNNGGSQISMSLNWVAKCLLLGQEIEVSSPGNWPITHQGQTDRPFWAFRKKKRESRNFMLFRTEKHPTNPFTILEPLDQEIGEFYLAQEGFGTDMKDSKLWKCLLGDILFFFLLGGILGCQPQGPNFASPWAGTMLPLRLDCSPLLRIFTHLKTGWAQEAWL